MISNKLFDNNNSNLLIYLNTTLYKMSEEIRYSFDEFETAELKELLYMTEIMNMRIPRRGLKDNTYRRLLISKIRERVNMNLSLDASHHMKDLNRNNDLKRVKNTKNNIESNIIL